ncbi:hypothetical protein [uncultured Fibrobacter sp.]|uniref:hypothetical protein n=1 Tax=uncultured Fibrobacter sp. TaxID=261512 RepID=UPI00261D4200|nr:hypothetical protein [uncultured Fibrobacter sp.]
MGTGTQISYQAPPTNVFAYDANTTPGTWTATTQSALDDCGANKVWSVVGTAGSKTVSYAATVDGQTGDAALSNACGKLTPNFTNIGRGS